MRPKNIPEFVLKEKVKKEVLSSNIIKADIMSFFDKTHNTIERWIRTDSEESLNFNLLNIIWTHLYKKAKISYPKLTSLLTIKK